MEDKVISLYGVALGPWQPCHSSRSKTQLTGQLVDFTAAAARAPLTSLWFFSLVSRTRLKTCPPS